MNDTVKLMQQNSDWKDAKCSEQTRYGILSAIHVPTDMNCHFTFGTGVGVRNSDVVKCLFNTQPVGMFKFIINLISVKLCYNSMPYRD